MEMMYKLVHGDQNAKSLQILRPAMTIVDRADDPLESKPAEHCVRTQDQNSSNLDLNNCLVFVH